MNRQKFELGLRELKEQVLRIHRVAGQLDEIVQLIDGDRLFNDDGQNRFFIKACQARYRDCLNITPVSELHAKGELAWETLLSAFDKKEP